MHSLKQKGGTKKKMFDDLKKEIYLYITLKSKPANRPLLIQREDQEVKEYKEHFQSYLEFIDKTDMKPT